MVTRKHKNRNKSETKPTICVIPPPFISDTISGDLYLKKEYITFFQRFFNLYFISYREKKATLKKILNTVDAVYLTGSQLGNFNHNKEFISYNKKITYIIKTVERINEKGRIFPILACCNGFHSIIINNKTNNKYNNKFIKLDAIDYITNLIYTKDYKEFKNTNKKAYHDCTYGITPTAFSKIDDLNNNYTIIANAKDRTNKLFVTYIKHLVYPIYAFQFHPEISNTNFLNNFILDTYKSFNYRKIISNSNKKNTRRSYKNLKYKLYKTMKK